MLKDKHRLQTAPSSAGSNLCHEKPRRSIVTSACVVTTGDMGPVIAEIAQMGDGGAAQTIA